MERYTQEQKNNTEHCLRIRLQKKQDDHGPDALERLIEEWMGQEEITVEKPNQKYHAENERREEEESEPNSLKKLPQKQPGQGNKPGGKADQKKQRSSHRIKGGTATYHIILPNEPITTATETRRNNKPPRK